MVEELPAGNKLVGFYRGQVLKHCVQGKCKLWIPGVYPVEWRSSPQLIPDAEQAAPLFGGSTAGNGVFSWPDVGSIVWCFFQNGDQNMPVYFAAATGGPDAHDQYAACSNADTVFLQESQSESISSNNEMSRVHRLNSGCTNISLFENGCISARTSFPIESTSGTLGANCSYGEYLAHFYADKGLWSYSDIVPVEDKTLRLGVAVSKAGSASSFLASFQADADAIPPAIDVFFYVHKTGAGAPVAQEDEEELPPSQDAAVQQEEKTVQRNGIYFCTVGSAKEALKFSYADTMQLLDEQLKFASKNNYELFVCQGDLIADIGSFIESGTRYIAQGSSAGKSSSASNGASSAGGGGSGSSSSSSLLNDVSGAAKSTSSAAGTVSSAASSASSAAGSLNNIINGSLGSGASSISNAAGQINSIASQTSSTAKNIDSAAKGLSKATSGELASIPSGVASVTSSIDNLTGGQLGSATSQLNNAARLATSVSKDFQTVTSVVKDIAPGAADALDSISQDLNGLGADAASSLKDMASGLTDTVSGIVDSIKETASEMMDSAKEAASSITDSIKGIGASASEATAGMTDKVTNQETDDFAAIVSKLFSALKKIAKVLAKYMSGSAAAVMMQVNAAISTATQTVGMLKKFFNRAKELLDWNKDNVQKLKDELDKDSEATKKIQEEQKQKVQQKTQQLAAQYGISILAVYPKHVCSDIVMSNDGIISACTYNNFTQQKTQLDIDTDGKFQICASHILSNDMSLPDKDTLGKSYGLMTMDSTGNACINGVYQTPKEEVSCVFDMTTRECIRLELTKSNLIPATDEHKDDLVCSYVCDTSQGTVDLSAAYYDNLTQKNNYAAVRLTKNGEVYINSTTALDVFVRPDLGGMMSHVNMTKDGVITVDSTQSISIKSPYISIEGNKIDVLANMISAQSTQLEADIGEAKVKCGAADVKSSSITTDSNSIETKASSMQVDSSSMFINGMVGDCNIQRISLTRHIHPCPDGSTGTPIPT